MSIEFSNTTTKSGIIQQIEQRCGFDDGYISSNSELLAKFTGQVNIAMDRVFSTIFEVGGTWQFDDSNHTTFPIITTDINTGQRNYAFTTDGNSNLVLEIHKVFVADEQGLFREVSPVDVPSGTSNSNMWDGLETTGQPNSYDKIGNGILLDPIPNYDAVGGLKLYISREGSYFATTDTTKKAGFAGLFHEYLILYPSYVYASINTLASTRTLRDEVEIMENKIRDYYKAREKDVQKTIRTLRVNPR